MDHAAAEAVAAILGDVDELGASCREQGQELPVLGLEDAAPRASGWVVVVGEEVGEDLFFGALVSEDEVGEGVPVGGLRRGEVWGR